MPFETFWQTCKQAYEDEVRRNHSTARIDEVVIFDDLDEKMLLEYSLLDCKRRILISQEKLQELEKSKADYRDYVKSRYAIETIPHLQ